MKILTQLKTLILALALFGPISYGQTAWPPERVNTTIRSNDIWQFRGIGLYLNGFNLGGTTGNNGCFIWNNESFCNPSDFKGRATSNIIADNQTNTYVYSLEFQTEENSPLTIGHGITNGKSTLTFNFLPISIFSGPNTTGLVTSAAADTNKYLKSDGTWAEIEIPTNTFLGPNTTGFVTSVDVDTNKFLRGDGTWGVVATQTNVWTKGDLVTNAQPAPNTVGALEISLGAVETDELANEAVSVQKLSSFLFTNDLYKTGVTIQVRGVYGKKIPSPAGHAGHALTLDSNTNWAFTAGGVGDMLRTNWSTNALAGYWVDGAVMSKYTTNALGILGFPLSTNGRTDESVITFDLGSRRYAHRSLADLGGGDMLKATYDTNTLTTGTVDRADIATLATGALTATNTIKVRNVLFQTPAASNDAMVVVYDNSTPSFRYFDLSGLGYGDMLKLVYDTNSNNRVDQIDNNCISSNQIIDSSIVTADLANGSVTPAKTTGILTTNTSFTGGDLDGSYNTLTLQKIQGRILKLGTPALNDVIAFNADGTISNKPNDRFTAIIDAQPISIASNSLTLSETNKYYYAIITNTVTNWNVGKPAAGKAALYKLDINYSGTNTFAWGGDLAQCTNLPTPPPQGASSYVFEIIAGTTVVRAYP